MRRLGGVMIEVLAAIAILTLVGLSSVGFVVELGQTQERLIAREREILAASRVLAASALLTRTELEQRLGPREVGAFVVTVQRPERDLFWLSVAAMAVPGRALLTTAVYVPLEESE